VLEAMAMGLPIVADAHQRQLDVVATTTTACWCRPRTEALGAARRLIDDPALAARWARARACWWSSASASRRYPPQLESAYRAPAVAA
jgi:hypothetical protein